MIASSEPLDEQSHLRDVIRAHTALHDCLFLGLVVLLSFILYVHRLGFYIDDWAFLSWFNMSKDQSLSGLYQALFNSNLVIRQRPVQISYLALSYKLFGLHPLGSHLVNGVVLIVSAILFYLVMRELRQSRLLALTVPLVYILLPHYSTDRFWIAAFQATLSLALYFLSLYADLRALPSRFWRWKLLSIISLIASGLAYEVVLPLFLLNLLLIRNRLYQIHGPVAGKRLVQAKAGILFGGNLLALLLVIIFKALVTVRVNVTIDLISHVASSVAGAIRVNYGTYGLGLPYILGWILYHQPGPTIITVAVVLGLLIFAYLYHVAGRSQLPRRRTSLNLIGIGLISFGFGYSIFVVSADIWFTSASVGNRVAIAAAIGVALSFVGVLSWLNSFLPSARWRRTGFCLLVTLLSVTGFLINNVLAVFWADAYRQQQAILTTIHQHVPTLPAHSTFILDGICLERGGAYIFTGKSDLAGALIIAYQDPSLWATAVTHAPKIEEEGLSLFTHNTYDRYPYGENLLVYNFDQKRVYQLIDEGAAHSYFQRANFNPIRDCPPGFAWDWNSR